MVMPGETSVCESCVKYLMVNIPFCWLLKWRSKMPHLMVTADGLYIPAVFLAGAYSMKALSTDK